MLQKTAGQADHHGRAKTINSIRILRIGAPDRASNERGQFFIGAS